MNVYAQTRTTKRIYEDPNGKWERHVWGEYKPHLSIDLEEEDIGTMLYILENAVKREKEIAIIAEISGLWKEITNKYEEAMIEAKKNEEEAEVKKAERIAEDNGEEMPF